jgi:hypothetical protein
MPPKRKKPTKAEDKVMAGTGTKAEDDEVKAGSHVYVLTRKVYNHADSHSSAVELIGIYSSKSAAVASAGGVDTEGYGTFDEAINDEMFEESHEDYRNPAPDYGLLLKIGHEDEGEGDNVQLFIEKTRVLGMPDPSTKRAKPSKNKEANSMKSCSDYYC